MRVIIQRVKKASVSVSGIVKGRINNGFLIFLGIGKNDAEEDLKYLVAKVSNLRAFPDSEGKMNLSLRDVGAEILVVSQFTLFGDCRRGRRPSFTEAADPETARQLYEKFIMEIEKSGIRTQTGVFQVEMEVSLVNDGPVTFMLDSTRLF